MERAKKTGEDLEVLSSSFFSARKECLLLLLLLGDAHGSAFEHFLCNSRQSMASPAEPFMASLALAARNSPRSE